MSISGKPFETQALHPLFGARLLGLDLSGPLPAATVQALRDAFDEHSVLVFRDQRLEAADQVRFSRLFGPLEKAITRMADEGPGQHVAYLGNVGADGELIDPGDRSQLFHKANQLWHTDSSFKPQPALASMLYAREVPVGGGETQYASTRAAYQALPGGRRDALQGLWATHDFNRSRNLVAPGLVDEGVQRMLPPVARPLVRTNPRNARGGLYIASHAVAVEGMGEQEGRRLLDELLDACTGPGSVYTHRWAPGDLVMWDNRCTVHRGRPFDASRERRVMWRTTVIDEAYDDEPEVRARAA